MEETDWQLNKDLTACTKYMLENAVYSDVQFRVGEAGEVIKAHKSILAMRSPVFDKMFFGSLPENRSETVISDVEPLVFKALLRYCYYECLDVEPELALSTQYTAKKYMLPLLEKACRETQIKNLLPENIWDVYISSMEWGDEELHKGCQAYLKKNVSAIASALKLPTFLSLPHKVLLDILQLNDIESSQYSYFPEMGKHGILIAEIELFKACDAWAEAECKRQGLEVSGSNKRNVLGDCLPLIRFPTISGQDLVKTVFPTGILTHDENFSVLDYVQNIQHSGVENKTGFLCTNQHFLIRLTPTDSDVANDELMKKLCKCNSEINLEPKYNLQLNRIWIRGESCQCKEPELHFTDHKGVAIIDKPFFYRQDEMTEDGRTPLLNFPHGLLLEAGKKYLIKVIHQVRKGKHLHDHTANGPIEDSDMTLDKKAKLPNMVGLEVTEGGRNNCIVALTTRLL